MSTVLILGAGSDMAIATARKFALNHFDIQLAGRNDELLDALKKDLHIRYKIAVSSYVFDARDFDSHPRFYEYLDPKPDIVICLFGYLGNQKKGEQSWHEAQKIIDTNYLGAVSILNIIANDYEKKQSGIIVGVSSVAAERGRQSNYLYGSAKAGLTIYLSGLRNRLFGCNVHVVSVIPGFVYTKMTEALSLPPLLTAHPQDVADSIYKAVLKKRNIIYIKWFWKWIMLFIIAIPESIFKRTKL